jgi:hypothetical protein
VGGEQIVVVGDPQVVLVDQVVRAEDAAPAGQVAGQEQHRVSGVRAPGGRHDEQIDVVAAARVAVRGPARQRQHAHERQARERADDVVMPFEQLTGAPDAVLAPRDQLLPPAHRQHAPRIQRQQRCERRLPDALPDVVHPQPRAETRPRHLVHGDRRIEQIRVRDGRQDRPVGLAPIDLDPMRGR